MGIIFDLIIALIMIVTVICAYKKGFVSSLLSFASSIISGIATFIFYKPLALFLNERFIQGKTTVFIRDKISEMTQNGNVEALITDMPENFKTFLSNLGFSPESIQQSFSESGMSATKYADNLAQRLASDISYLIACVIAIISIFIVASVVCAIASFFINSIFRLPVLNFANKSLGLVMGVITALILGWLISISASMVINVLASLYPENVSSTLIANSIAVKLFSTINPISLIQ